MIYLQHHFKHLCFSQVEQEEVLLIHQQEVVEQVAKVLSEVEVEVEVALTTEQVEQEEMVEMV
jgi:hypothetical protein